MKRSVKTGLSFGITSGVITPLGLMVGLNTSTGLRLAVVGGLLTVAIADSLSDAMGIHMSEESNPKNSHREVWESTLAAFFAKFLIALSFVVPLLFLPLSTAILVSVLWGFLLLILFNVLLARQRGESALIVIKKHLFLALGVVVASHFVGKLIASFFA